MKRKPYIKVDLSLTISMGQSKKVSFKKSITFFNTDTKNPSETFYLVVFSLICLVSLRRDTPH